jgi:hypothetical protein
MRASKFIRRRTAALASAAAFVILLVGFGIGMTTLARRLATERNLAQLRRCVALGTGSRTVPLQGQGRLLLAHGNAAEAEQLLREALAITRMQKDVQIDNCRRALWPVKKRGKRFG